MIRDGCNMWMARPQDTQKGFQGLSGTWGKQALGKGKVRAQPDSVRCGYLARVRRGASPAWRSGHFSSVVMVGCKYTVQYFM
jgi:hypothetical protein